jgi:formylmethanofuran dehydrogenase subunit E
MKQSFRLTGNCDKCGENAELHGTENYGEWVCEKCKTEKENSND